VGFVRCAGGLPSVRPLRGRRWGRHGDSERLWSGSALVLEELYDADAVQRFVELNVEVLDPEVIEVAEDDVVWAAGDEAGPIVEGLAIGAGGGRSRTSSSR
jgi:hypothetical protein